jgi:hypothetical protein
MSAMLIPDPAATLTDLGAAELLAKVMEPTFSKSSFCDGKFEEDVCTVVITADETTLLTWFAGAAGTSIAKSCVLLTRPEAGGATVNAFVVVANAANRQREAILRLGILNLELELKM